MAKRRERSRASNHHQTNNTNKPQIDCDEISSSSATSPSPLLFHRPMSLLNQLAGSKSGVGDTSSALPSSLSSSNEGGDEEDEEDEDIDEDDEHLSAFRQIASSRDDGDEDVE